MQVSAIMNRYPLIVRADTLAADAERVAAGRRCHHLLVSQHDDLVGVICVGDLRRAADRASVFELLRDRVVAIGPRVTAERAAAIMAERGIGCLPIVDDGFVAGIVTRDELLRAGVELAPPAKERGP